MRKQIEESTAAESARRAPGAAAERDRRGRFSARRKRATVLRLLRGEFQRTYNEQWMLAKYDYRSPAQVRRDFDGLDAVA